MRPRKSPARSRVTGTPQLNTSVWPSTRVRMGTATVSMDLLTFLKDWLVQHIMGTDPTYLPYLKPEDKEPAKKR